MAEFICYNRIPQHVKAHTGMHNMVVQPAMLHGMETVSTASSNVKKLQVTEMKMFRWASRTPRCRLINDNTWKRRTVENITKKVRKATLRWFGHGKRRYQ